MTKKLVQHISRDALPDIYQINKMFLHLLQVLNYVALVNFAKIFNVRKAMKILI
jgi:hypothetical protein